MRSHLSLITHYSTRYEVQRLKDVRVCWSGIEPGEFRSLIFLTPSTPPPPNHSIISCPSYFHWPPDVDTVYPWKRLAITVILRSTKSLSNVPLRFSIYESGVKKIG